MKKKTLALLLILVLLCTIFVLVACKDPNSEDTDNGDGHAHSYSEAWSRDKQYHWRNALCGCEPKDMAEHSYEDGICSVCQYDSSNGLKFEIFEDGSDKAYAVIGIKEENDATNIDIPSAYDGLPVKKIANSAFLGKSIKSIFIPKSVICIEFRAFEYCGSLVSVDIEDDSQLAIIESQAFKDCTSLDNIWIPSSVKSIGDKAFDNCSGLTSVKFGRKSQLASIEEDTFANCTSLKSIEIPSGVTSILPAAFSGCSNLTTVKFAENSQLEIISYFAFQNCINLKRVELPETVTIINDNAFYKCNKLEYNEYENGLYLGNNDNPYVALIKTASKDITNFKINEKTKMIGVLAFANCSSLSSIVIPDSVVSIGEQSFVGCVNLSSIEIRNNIKIIMNHAFSRCMGLVIYCEVESQPSGWDSKWNSDNCRVEWGCNIGQ